MYVIISLGFVLTGGARGDNLIHHRRVPLGVGCIFLGLTSTPPGRNDVREIALTE